MVLATMADSEREELEKLIEDWNASRLDMFTISKPDAVSDCYVHSFFLAFYPKLWSNLMINVSKLHYFNGFLNIPCRTWSFLAICGSIFKNPGRKT